MVLVNHIYNKIPFSPFMLTIIMTGTNVDLNLEIDHTRHRLHVEYCSHVLFTRFSRHSFRKIA